MSEKWKESLGCTDFEDSVWAADLEIGVRSKKGYYLYDNMVYYLYNDSFYDWYVYDEDWNPLDSESIPYPLNHSSKSSEYYKSKSYSNILEETDFDESIYYQDYQSINSTNDGYFHTANRVFYHMDSNYYSNWYEYTNDTWSEIEYVDLPENFEHPSSVNEFYFTPEWDASTQFSDFKDSAFYQDAHKSDDEDYDWGSDNSWDSNSTDWNSNW